VLPSSAAEHYATQQRLTLATLGLTRREWANMGSDFDASWAKVGPRISLLTASAQLGAARNGAAYVPKVLAELGQSVDPLAEVDPRAFAGIASDGRLLDSLLSEAVIASKVAKQTTASQGQGMTTTYSRVSDTDALSVGGRWLDMAVQTLVADAARGAASVAIAARPGIGYVRMVNPPSCGRCSVLAGKFFKWNTGFQRHPHCDCSHVPSGEVGAEGLTTDPRPDQITGLSKAERKALDEGSDLSQVVNAKRGASGMTTTEGTTKRGLAGQRLAGRQRLTPDGIYRIASDRTEALALLREHGYLAGGKADAYWRETNASFRGASFKTKPTQAWGRVHADRLLSPDTSAADRERVASLLSQHPEKVVKKVQSITLASSPADMQAAGMAVGFSKTEAQGVAAFWDGKGVTMGPGFDDLTFHHEMGHAVSDFAAKAKMKNYADSFQMNSRFDRHTDYALSLIHI